MFSCNRLDILCYDFRRYKTLDIEVTGPIDKIGGGLGGTILKRIYNFAYYLFGTYTNFVCSILLITSPIIAVAGIFLKKK